MLTKQQKIESIKESVALIKASRFLVFVDFSKTKVEDMRNLRRVLLAIGADLKVIKKKLLRIALKESGIDFNPEQFETQAAAIFSNQDIPETAAPVYKFSKTLKKSAFRILGGYDLVEKKFLDAETVKAIGNLPGREVLLGQLVGMIASPIRTFLYVLDQRSRRIAGN